VRSRKKILLKLFVMPADACRLSLQGAGCTLSCAAEFPASVLPESVPQWQQCRFQIGL